MQRISADLIRAKPANSVTSVIDLSLSEPSAFHTFLVAMKRTGKVKSQPGSKPKNEPGWKRDRSPSQKTSRAIVIAKRCEVALLEINRSE